jgi:hypothetical protein
VTVLLAVLALGVATCDSGTDVQADPGAVVGTWISAGDALAPYYRIQLERDSIITTFTEDGVWTSTQYIASYAFGDTGVYEIDEGDGPIFGFTVLAEPPATDTLGRGIFRVVGDTMQLEMVGPGQLTPPTVAGGFGSTERDGVEGGPYWVQVYLRRE